MAVLYHSPSLQSSELLALYGREADPYRGRERGHGYEYDDVDSEGSEEGRVNMRSSLSQEEGYGVERGERSGLGRVYFSNQDYYQRLEQLQRTHLRNMAELEKMYICKRSKVNKKDDEEDKCLEREGRDIQNLQPSVTSESQSSGSMPVRRLQRILSDEELNFHEETSSDVSDQSGDGDGGDGEEEDNHYELLLEEREEDSHSPRAWSRKDKALRNSLRDRQSCCPESVTTTARKQPSCTSSSRSQLQIQLQLRGCCPKSQGRNQGGNLSKTGRRTIGERGTVTVPEPFRMMMREEEKKRRKLRTRSEVELENLLLRRELDELRECGMKFRASPAPAHTRLPLYDVISHRLSQRPGYHPGNHKVNLGNYRCVSVSGGNQRASSCSPQRPFSFLERERRKREQRIEAELANLVAKEERRAFKARPVPRSVYYSHSATHRQESKLQQQLTSQKMKLKNMTHHHSKRSTPGLQAEAPGEKRGDTEGAEDQGLTLVEKEEKRIRIKKEGLPSYDSNSYWRSQSRSRRPSIKMGMGGPRKQLELQIEMESERRKGKERERELSYIDPLCTPGGPYNLCSSLVSQEDLPLPASKTDYISVCKSRDQVVESVL
uniref:Protein FAM161A n=1 Tax=Hucho hucho TaxID=62062 RepID=A0A4W5MVA5_9TELE